jgi:hypothetical protein
MIRDKWKILAEKAFQFQELRKKYETLERGIKEKLKEESNWETQKAYGFSFEVQERKGAVDYDRIPELHIVNVELYRKPPVRMWKLTKKN